MKVNYQNRQINNNQDHMVIIQSLESELERERKVRIVIETDKQELINQLKSVKERSQQIITSLKHLNEQNDAELKKQRDSNSELTSEIQALKCEAKNNVTIQEDLVRLVQKLQIDLEILIQRDTLSIIFRLKGLLVFYSTRSLFKISSAQERRLKGG